METLEFFTTILEKYLQRKVDVNESFTMQGELPTNICDACYHWFGSRLFIKVLETQESEFYYGIKDELSKMKTIKIENKIEYYRDEIDVSMLGVPNFDYGSGYGINTNDRYSYRTYSLKKYSEFYLNSYYSELIKLFNKGINYCSHFDGVLDAINNNIKPCKLIEENREYNDESKKVIKGQTLYFCCPDCNNSISKHACKDAAINLGGVYSKNFSCSWPLALEALIFKENDIEYQSIGALDEILLLNSHYGLLSTQATVDSALIKKYTPKLLIIHGTKKDVIQLMRHKVSILCLENESSKLIRFDASKQSNCSLQNILNKISNNLQSIAYNSSGNEHDRFINAFAIIGRELNFISQREYSVKGSRVDCAWLDRDGSTFAAIEVEMTGAIKKDIITTWEMEPQLAIILNSTKTDKSFYDILSYSLLKFIPHTILLINVVTNNIYVIDNHDITEVIPLKNRVVEE